MNKQLAYSLWYNKTHGLELQPYKNTGYRQTTENGILYLAELVMLYDMLGILEPNDLLVFSNTVKNIQVPDKEGLFCRGQDEWLESYKTRRSISHDNITAISCGSKILGIKSYPEDIVKRGFLSLGTYNNIFPRLRPPMNPGNFSPWAALADYNILAYLFLPFFILGYLVMLTKPNNNTSGKKLYLLKLYALRDKFIFSLIYKHFTYIMKKRYGKNFISEIYKIYYPIEHPLNYYANLL